MTMSKADHLRKLIKQNPGTGSAELARIAAKRLQRTVRPSEICDYRRELRDRGEIITEPQPAQPQQSKISFLEGFLQGKSGTASQLAAKATRELGRTVTASDIYNGRSRLSVVKNAVDMVTKELTPEVHANGNGEHKASGPAVAEEVSESDLTYTEVLATTRRLTKQLGKEELKRLVDML